MNTTQQTSSNDPATLENMVPASIIEYHPGALKYDTETGIEVGI